MAIRSNEEWLRALKAKGDAQNSALEDLSKIIQAGMPYALSKWIQPDDPRFTPLIDGVIQETLIKVLTNLENFEGRSQFTTWVYTIAVRVALTELRRTQWKEVSLDGLLETNQSGDEIIDFSTNRLPVDKEVEEREMGNYIKSIMQSELTEKQRNALVAIAIKGMPIEEVARRMGTQRNTLYKLLHDARLKLKRKMRLDGMD